MAAAAADTGDREKKFALKRINCANSHELIQSCRHEAGIHRSLPLRHPNLLELLGLKFDSNHGQVIAENNAGGEAEWNVCYMLFPYLPYSLRGEITSRNVLSLNDKDHQDYKYNPQQHRPTTRGRRPFTTKEALHLFRGILDGLMAMHNSNISHRDVKLENVLLQLNSYDDHHHHSHHSLSTTRYTPILMDFGSAGPLTSPPLPTRQSILQIIELASSQTTLSYRPPELSDSLHFGLRQNDGPTTTTTTTTKSCILDYGKVDVWSLGCVLFGILHGVSPFEMEFIGDKSGGGGGSSSSYGGGAAATEEDGQYGLVKVVDCTNLKILKEVPFPPWAAGMNVASQDVVVNNHTDDVGDGRNGKYPLSIYKFIRYMVQHDRMVRPNIHEVAKRFGELHYNLLHEEWIPYCDKGGGGDEEHDGFDSLIASRDFV